MKKPVTVKFYAKKHQEGAIRATFKQGKPGDGAYDIYPLDSGVLKYGDTKVVSTGIHVEIPEGYRGRICTKSGSAIKGVLVGAGLIDAGYRGDVGVVLHHLRPPLMDGERQSYYDVHYSPDKPIAQFFIEKVIPIHFEEVAGLEDLSSSERGEGGYGSTGGRLQTAKELDSGSSSEAKTD